MNVAIIFGRKNSKGLKNKNITKFLGKPACLYPIVAAKKSKKISKVFISSDSKYINKIGKLNGCEVLHRPKKLATDNALLSDAIFDSVNKIKNKFKIKNVVILLCNSICINHQTIDKAISKLRNKRLDTVTTISKFNMFSPVRSMKLKNDKIVNFIPEKILSKYTPLSGDRNKSIDSYIITHSCTVSKINVLLNKKKNPMPFVWMGKNKGYIKQENCVGDIDFEWQKQVATWWLKKYL